MTQPNVITFRVYGVPAPGGSKRGFVNPRNGRVIIVEDSKRNKGWRESVKEAALRVLPPALLTGPLMLSIRFLMPRPKSHYRETKKSGVQLRHDAPVYHCSKPDTTKLIRSTEDALTGVLWVDDATIAYQVAAKFYTEDRPGAEITITPLIGDSINPRDAKPNAQLSLVD